MKQLLIVPIALIAFALPSFAGSDDTEFWVHVGGKHKLDETHKLSLSTDHRVRDDASEYYTYNVDVGYHSPLPKLTWFDAVWGMSVNARIEGAKHGNDWQQELRPHVNLAAAKKVGNFMVINRARLELRIFEERSDVVRVRNKTELAHPIPGMGHGMAAFVSEEFFIDSEGGQLSENRLMFGVKGRIDRWSPKVYIMDKADKIDNDYDHSFVIGVSAYTAF